MCSLLVENSHLTILHLTDGSTKFLDSYHRDHSARRWVHAMAACSHQGHRYHQAPHASWKNTDSSEATKFGQFYVYLKYKILHAKEYIKFIVLSSIIISILYHVLSCLSLKFACLLSYFYTNVDLLMKSEQSHPDSADSPVLQNLIEAGQGRFPRNAHIQHSSCPFSTRDFSVPINAFCRLWRDWTFHLRLKRMAFHLGLLIIAIKIWSLVWCLLVKAMPKIV